MQRRQQLCEALPDRLLVVVVDEPRQRAKIFRQPRHRGDELVDRRDALASEIGCLESIDGDSHQPPLAESYPDDAARFNVEARRAPIIENLIKRDRQRYTYDGHALKPLRADRYARAIAVVLFLNRLPRIGTKPLFLHDWLGDDRTCG
jgi:hypothetical protein